MAVGLRSLAVAAALILIPGLVGGAPSLAQVATDGTAGPRTRLAGPEFAIGADLGTKAGRNLFHSFEKFSLANGERAIFSGPKQIRNVISRVTGGARSDIDGTLASTIPGADLYFMNPAGVVFGPNARLDLLGSFHVSTADELRFADGTLFSARDPSASSFTVAAPEAFGFVRAAPAPILVARSMLGVPVGEALSLIGGDVVVVGGPGLSEGIIGGDGDNRIVVVALGPGGAYRLADGRISGSDFSDILLWGLAAVGTLNGGSVRIHADRIFMVDSDILNVQLSSAEPDEASILITGRRLEMSGGSQIVGDALCLAGLPCRIGQAGGITVRVDELLMLDAETEIISRGMNGARAGSVTLEVSKQLLLRRGTISTDSTVAGGGEIRVLVGDLAVLRDGALSTSVAGGADPTAGNITLDAEILIIDGSRIGANAPVGFGGQVRIEADNVLVPGGDFQALVDRGDISATGGDPSRAGTVVVSAPEVDLAGELIVPDAALLDAAALMRERCAARRDIGASSFTRVGRAGLPPSPDAPLAGGLRTTDAARETTPLPPAGSDAEAILAAATPAGTLALPCAPHS